MTYITVVDDSPAGTVENLDKLMTDILPEPDGLAARYAGMVDGKLCIVAIWDSRPTHAQAFMTQRLGPGLRATARRGCRPTATDGGHRGRALLRAVDNGRIVASRRSRARGGSRTGRRATPDDAHHEAARR